MKDDKLTWLAMIIIAIITCGSMYYVVSSSNNPEIITNTTTVISVTTLSTTVTFTNTLYDNRTIVITNTTIDEDLSDRLLTIYRVKNILYTTFNGESGTLGYFKWIENNWCNIANVTNRGDAINICENLGLIVDNYNNETVTAGKIREEAVGEWQFNESSFFNWYNTELWDVVLEAGIKLGG